MFIAKKHLPRRTFLRGIGATIALPLLDAMLPAGTALANTAAKPQHALHVRAPAARRDHGPVHAEVVGKNFDITPILEPFEPYQSYMTVISNLDHRMATSQSPEEAAGDHDRTASVFLSGAHVKRTAGPGHLRRHHDRPGARAEHRPRESAAVARDVHRGRRCARRLRRRV